MKIVICGAGLVEKAATSLAEKGAEEHAVTARVIDSEIDREIDREKGATA